MRALDPDLQARLDSGATTLCRCWRITRTDGTALGFTDHDRDLSFDGLTFRAECGLEGAAIERASGLAPDDTAVLGAFSDDAISAEDVRLGRYDRATVDLWLVDWRDPALRHHLFRGSIGRVERSANAFTAEVDGLSAPLNRPCGRTVLPVCDAVFGDARCGVDATGPAFTAEAAVAALEGDRTLVADGLEGFASDWFSHGVGLWLTGANAGLSAEVRRQDGPRLSLWRAPAAPVSLGDRLRLTAGCDKRLETCRDRFDNLLNFRGFPHVPGDDWVSAYPAEGERNDGGSRGG